MLIELKNKSAFVEIETKGAAVVSYMDALGSQYIIPSAMGTGADAANILFPIAGKLKEDTALIEGKQLCIPENGFVRDRAFKVAFRSEDKVILSLNSMGSDKGFLFEYSLQVTYFINGCTLEVSCTLFNPGESALPYGLGIQLPLLCPLPENGRLTDHYLRFDKPQTLSSPLYNKESKSYDPKSRVMLVEEEQEKKIECGWFRNGAVILDGLCAEKFSVSTLLSGRGMEVSMEGLPLAELFVPSESQTALRVAAMTGSVSFPASEVALPLQNGFCMLPPDEKRIYKLSFCPL